MLTFAKRKRTRSPRRMSRGDVPGKARPLNVKMLKSSITFGLGVAEPGSIHHSCGNRQKSRSIRRRGARGWMTRKPIIPIAICTVSSACGWYM